MKLEQGIIDGIMAGLCSRSVTPLWRILDAPRKSERIGWFIDLAVVMGKVVVADKLTVRSDGSEDEALRNKQLLMK